MRSSKLLHFLSIAAFVAGVLASAMPSHAYRMIQNTSTGRVTSGSAVTCNDPGGFVHWTTAFISWRHNTANQGSGKTSALMAALDSWTNVSGASHNLIYAGTTTAGWSTDGINTVLWANGNGCTGNCLALTALVLQQPAQVIVESDVTFNNSYTWTTTGANYDTQTVATHEFGHSLGIHHTELTSTPRPTMYATYFGSGGRTLESDDRAALQCSQSRYPVAECNDGATRHVSTSTCCCDYSGGNPVNRKKLIHERCVDGGWVYDGFSCSGQNCGGSCPL